MPYGKILVDQIESSTGKVLNTGQVTSELNAIARSLNVADTAVIYSTDTTTVLDGVLYIYDESTKTTWVVPTLASTGKTVASVSGSALTTTGGTGSSSYTLLPTRRYFFETVEEAKKYPLKSGDTVETKWYDSTIKRGGSTYLVQTAAWAGRAFVDLADHALDNGCYLYLEPANKASIRAEQCGVGYKGAGTDESANLQAAIDVMSSISASGDDTDAGWEVEINGYLRIASKITNASRTVLTGVSSVRSRIIWSGGSSTGAMIDFGSATWGGLNNIRVQGFDSAAGDDPIADGIEHLLRYSFVDFMHQFNNVHLVTGYSDAILIEDDTGESGVVNFNAYNTFFSNNGDGAMIEITVGEGTKRVINLIGLTGNNSPTSTVGLVDASAITSGLSINLISSRLEWQHKVPVDNYSFFRFGTTSTSSTRCNVSMFNVVGFVTEDNGTTSIVRATKKDTVSVSECGCNFNIPLIAYDDGSTTAGNGGLRTDSQCGFEVTRKPLGMSSIITGNYSDRVSSNTSSVFVGRGDVVFCNDDVCDYMVPDIDSDDADHHLYSYMSTGFLNAGRIADISSGSATANLDPSLPAGAGSDIGVAVRISGAGVAGGDLDTFIASIDRDSGTITFEDAASTTVSTTTLIAVRNPGWIQGYLKPRETTPANLSANSEGQSVYVTDIDATLTWSGDRWMYSGNHHVATGNRPVYTSNSKYTGLSVYDTTLGIPVWWNGTAWKDASGTTV